MKCEMAADRVLKRFSRQIIKEDAVKVVDGTTCSMPDTAESQKAYPQPGSQKPGCGFPMMKLVGLFCLASGALLEVVRGTLRVHESQLFRHLWPHLNPGDVLLAVSVLLTARLTASPDFDG